MMTGDLPVAILAGLGSMLGWGSADFFAKKTIDRLGDVPTLFWGQLLGIGPLLGLFLFHPALPDLSAGEWACVPMLGVWSGLSYVPTYVAFGKGKVSLLSPIFACYAVVVTILSALFLHEAIPLGRQVAFFVVFAGVVLISGDPRGMWAVLAGGRGSRGGIDGLKEILLAVCLYSLWLIALDSLLAGRDWVPLLLAIRIFSTLSLLGYARVTRRKLWVRDRQLWISLATIGVLDVAAFGSLSFGYSVSSHVSVVTMLSGAFSLPTILLARVFLKERATAVQTVGSLIVVAGIMLIPLL